MSAITTTMFPAACTVCQGPIIDNRPKKASGEYSAKYPDWKCQNESCMSNGYRTGGYVKADASAAAVATEAAATRQARPLVDWEELPLIYARCQHLALKATSAKWAEANPAAFVAVCATFFIEARRLGLSVIGTAQKATPPQAPPQAPPEEEYPPLPEDDELPF